jgi:NAD(P)-dependent dehydrogenase (short-subunit alcohol dehydrogenase family)
MSDAEPDVVVIGGGIGGLAAAAFLVPAGGSACTSRGEQAGPAIEAVIRGAGGVDVLVNNAGYGLFASVEQSDDAAARAQFDTNFFAGLTVLRVALPALRASRGRIVQISSFLGQLAWPGSGLYSASKSAVELVSDALALELASAGVQVSTIQPGVFGTEFSASAHVVAPNETYEGTVGTFLTELSSLPAEALGDPARVVEAVLAVVAHPKPPRRLPVGRDAAEGIRNALQTQLAEMAEWEPVRMRGGPA